MGTDSIRLRLAAVILPLITTSLLGCTQIAAGILTDGSTLTPGLAEPAMAFGTSQAPEGTEAPHSPPTLAVATTPNRALTAGPNSTPPSLVTSQATAAPMPTEKATRTTTTVASPTASPSPTATPPAMESIIGYSSEDRPIVAYQFGHGSEIVVLVGGMHGGYEWNSILLAYEAIDYFTDRPEAIPESATLYILPSANPDGQYAVTGKEGRFEVSDLTDNTMPGRFNSRGVDLNRNWDCLWSEAAFWRNQPINPGTQAFSEPESVAMRDFLLGLRPDAVIFYHSAADGVFGAHCPEVYLPSRRLADVYGEATGYQVHDYFDAYEITGDAGDWLATQGIPAVTVELANHEETQWEKNLPGIQAVLERYARSLPKWDHILPVSPLRQE